jgi:hypothetical protein
MSDEDRTRTFAYRFLLIWGALAALNFIVAAVLTATLVRVGGLEPPYHPIGMYGRYTDSNAVGWIYYYRTRLGGTYLIYFPPHTKLVALPYEKSIECTENRPSGHRIAPPDISTSDYQGHVFYVIALSSQSNGSAADGEATCKLNLTPTRSSFTSFSLDMWFDPAISGGVSPARTLNFSAQIDGAENMQVFGGRATSSASVALGPDDESLIEFNDVRREGLRDIILIVIGALVGLGAAMALEAIRPYVELAASRRRRPHR